MNLGASLEELLDRQEPLLPELQPYVTQTRFGDFPAVHHPFLISVPYHEQMNAVINAQFRAITADAERKLAEHNYVGWIFRHERPYRYTAFEQIRAKLSDEDYWTALGALYIDTENLHQWGNRRLRVFFEAKRPGRAEGLMDEDERAALAALPDIITVYRGYDHNNARGWSWTLDRAKALWFANRWHEARDSEPRLATAQVRREKVIAYFAGRGESEIVVDPRDLLTVRTAPARVAAMVR